ncbi:hypothetical protein MtrunA17_Chr3g0098021 [Medicago truncatula]|uniref:LCR-like protein n=1 Tax=Medicago truncatula TaxID=3880 RepID=G7J1B4_MEDTR|nr:LCR-like protein [Medicago truncatula]RHN67010.1 hypothetical protein MtrunA17_Chr3g0098021 [Medicago truncatula]
MAKHISQYFLLGILCIVLVLALGPTPVLSQCIWPGMCLGPAICDARCKFLLRPGGRCLGFVCCCT